MPFFTVRGPLPIVTVPPATGVVWNSADKAAGISLSNGDLTATELTGVGDNLVRSTTSKAAGSYYFEVTLTATTTGVGVGIAKGAAALTGSYLGQENDTIGYFNTNGVVASGNVALGTFAQWTTPGDIIGIAWIVSSGHVWFRKNGGIWNGNAAFDPATDTGSVQIALAGATAWFAAGEVDGAVLTLNTGSTAFANAAPSGFSAYTP